MVVTALVAWLNILSNKFDNTELSLIGLSDDEITKLLNGSYDPNFIVALCKKYPQIKSKMLKCVDAHAAYLKLHKSNIDKKISESPAIIKSALEKFKSPDILIQIHDELTKLHLYDSRAKMTCFIGACTSFFEPKDRISIAIFGDSSVGKDNIMRMLESVLPDNQRIFLTNATQSVLEDDIIQPIVMFSEQNINKDNGANQHLIEAVKQLTEGGMSAYKKDISTGFREAKHVKQDQKCVFYASTEIKRDAEMDTRFLNVSLSSRHEKIEAVNDATLDYFGSVDNVVSENKSWIKIGLEHFSEQKRDVTIPFAPLLKGQINCDDVRSMRDLKRQMRMVKAMAWLHQEQRDIIQVGDRQIIIADPTDYFNVITISGAFFNQTYTGLQQRVQDVFNFAKREYGDGVEFLRSDLQSKLKVSRNTIKSYFKILSDQGYVEYIDKGDNSTSSKVFYKIPVNLPVKTLSTPVNENDLYTLLTGDLIGKNLLKEYPTISTKNTESLTIDIFDDLRIEISKRFAGRIDRVNLTGQKSPEMLRHISDYIRQTGLELVHYPDLRSAGYTDADIGNALDKGEIMEPRATYFCVPA